MCGGDLGAPDGAPPGGYLYGANGCGSRVSAGAQVEDLGG